MSYPKFKDKRLLENIIPDDEQLSYRMSLNAWNLIYKLMDNVRVSMSHTKQGKQTIGISDVENVVNYIKKSLDDIIKETITPPQEPNISKTNNKNNNTNENKTMKKTIRLTESELKGLIQHILSETILTDGKREIFTINPIDITNDESLDDMQYAGQVYYSFEEAIHSAKNLAKKFVNYDSVVNIFVMAGEYETPNGDIYGEPEAVYCVSSKNPKETAIARKKAGYTSLKVDEYIENDSFDEAITRAIYNVLH